MHFSKTFPLCFSLLVCTIGASPVDISSDLSIRELSANLTTRNVSSNDLQAREGSVAALHSLQDAAGSIPLAARSLFHKPIPVHCVRNTGFFCEKNCACTKGGGVSCEKLSKEEVKKWKKMHKDDEQATLEEHASQITDICAGVCRCNRDKLPGTKVRKIGLQLSYGDLKAAVYHVTEKDTRGHPPIPGAPPVDPHAVPSNTPPAPPSYHPQSPAIDPYNSEVDFNSPSLQRRGSVVSNPKDPQDGAGQSLSSREQTPPSCKGSNPVNASPSLSLRRRGTAASSPKAHGYMRLHSGPNRLPGSQQEPILCPGRFGAGCKSYCYCTGQGNLACDRLPESQATFFKSYPDSQQLKADHLASMFDKCKSFCGCMDREGVYRIDGRTVNEWRAFVQAPLYSTPHTRGSAPASDAGASRPAKPRSPDIVPRHSVSSGDSPALSFPPSGINAAITTPSLSPSRSHTSLVLHPRDGAGSVIKKRTPPSKPRLACHLERNSLCETKYTCDDTGMILNRRKSFGAKCAGLLCGTSTKLTGTPQMIALCKANCLCFIRGQGEIRQIGDTGEEWGGFRNPAHRGVSRRIRKVPEHDKEPQAVEGASSSQPGEQTASLHARADAVSTIKNKLYSANRHGGAFSANKKDQDETIQCSGPEAESCKKKCACTVDSTVVCGEKFGPATTPWIRGAMLTTGENAQKEMTEQEATFTGECATACKCKLDGVFGFGQGKKLEDLKVAEAGVKGLGMGRLRIEKWPARSPTKSSGSPDGAAKALSVQRRGSPGDWSDESGNPRSGSSRGGSHSLDTATSSTAAPRMHPLKNPIWCEGNDKGFCEERCRCTPEGMVKCDSAATWGDLFTHASPPLYLLDPTSLKRLKSHHLSHVIGRCVQPTCNCKEYRGFGEPVKGFRKFPSVIPSQLPSIQPRSGTDLVNTVPASTTATGVKPRSGTNVAKPQGRPRSDSKGGKGVNSMSSIQERGVFPVTQGGPSDSMPFQPLTKTPKQPSSSPENSQSRKLLLRRTGGRPIPQTGEGPTVGTANSLPPAGTTQSLKPATSFGPPRHIICKGEG